MNVSFTKSNSQPAAGQSSLKSDNISKDKKFTPPFGTEYRTGFEKGDLAIRKATSPASVEKFRSLSFLQKFVSRLYLCNSEFAGFLIFRRFRTRLYTVGMPLRPMDERRKLSEQNLVKLENKKFNNVKTQSGVEF